MKTFTRDDGSVLQVVAGYRQQTRSYRPAAYPRENWSDEDYLTAADTRLEKFQKRLGGFTRRGIALKDAHILEIGCGAGIDCLLLGIQGVAGVVGMDMEFFLFHPSDKGERTRKLVRTILAQQGFPGTIDEALNELPVHFLYGNAAHIPLREAQFDLLWSRSVLEHVIPLQKALFEMVRVVRPDGWIYHLIDPYYWIRGCHKRGVVDLPWAHARLTLDEYRRFVREHEGEEKAKKRCARLESLNRLTLCQWREALEAGPFEVLQWKESEAPFAVQMLEEHPEVAESLLDGVERRDLTHSRIKVWLRNKGSGA